MNMYYLTDYFRVSVELLLDKDKVQTIAQGILRIALYRRSLKWNTQPEKMKKL